MVTFPNGRLANRLQSDDGNDGDYRTLGKTRLHIFPIVLSEEGLWLVNRRVRDPYARLFNNVFLKFAQLAWCTVFFDVGSVFFLIPELLRQLLLQNPAYSEKTSF